MQSSSPVNVIVFDLNGTFYNKSSKDEFYKFICRRRPKRIKYFLQMAYYKMLVKLHRINQTEFKENFFNYLNGLPVSTVKEYATAFWQQEFPANFNRELLAHFEAKKKEGMQLFCATGALEVYVKPLFDMYKVDAFAGTKTEYLNNTYQVIGEACKDEEKIKRLRSYFNNATVTIKEAYSDSAENILDEAEKAFLVKDEKLIPYHSRGRK